MPGRRSRAAVALLVAGVLAGSRGGSGPALVGSSTTRPLPDHHRGRLDHPAIETTAAPTTRGIPTTTGRVPLTTRRPAGRGAADLPAPRHPARQGLAGRRRRRPRGGRDQPGLPAQRRRGRLPRVPAPRPQPDRHRQPARPLRPGHGVAPGGRVEVCPQDRDGLAEVPPAKPAKKGMAKVGGKDAIYRSGASAASTPNRRARDRLHPAGLVPQAVRDPGRGRVVDPRLKEALAAGRFG